MLDNVTRWSRILAYIDSHLDEPLTTGQLCQIAHFSPFHFHRQFMAYFGINVASYIKLVRFKQAAYLLVYRQASSITEIGLAVGFTHTEVFSRSFKRWSGQCPRAFRALPPWEFMHLHEQQLNRIRTPVMPAPTHDYKVDVVQFPALRLAVLSHRGAPTGLGESLNNFIRWRKQHGLHPSKFRTFNIIYTRPDIEPKEDFRLDLAVELKQPHSFTAEPIELGEIQGGLCARICYQGDDAGLGPAVEYLYGHWLSENPYELRDAPLFFERITFFPDVPINQRQTHIYLPLVAN